MSKMRASVSRIQSRVNVNSSTRYGRYGLRHVVVHQLRDRGRGPSARKPDVLHRRHEPLGVAVHDDRVEARLEPLPLAGLPPLDEPEVEERHAAVVVEAVVAGVRVAVERAEALDRVLAEAPDHLAGALLGLRASAAATNWSHDIPSIHSVVSTRSVDSSGTSSGMRTHGWPAKWRGELGDVARLEAVVELLAHPGAQLVDEPAGVEAVERHRREHVVHHLGAVEVLLDRLADARELHLDRDVAAVGRLGPVDLADAGRGDGQVVPAPEHLLRVVRRARRATTSAASVGAIGAASACSAASAAWASSGRPSAMKLTSWPTFISTPFISPSSLATSSAVRMANCSSSSARRSAGVTSWRALVPAKRVALRAVSLHIRRDRHDITSPELAAGRRRRARRGRSHRRRRRRRGPVSRAAGRRPVGRVVSSAR